MRKLSTERKDQLEEVGFEFVVEPQGMTWEAGLSQLKAYQQKHGNCDVPINYEESPQLLYWAFYQVGACQGHRCHASSLLPVFLTNCLPHLPKLQREQFRKGKLGIVRKSQLAELGFQWDQKWPTARASTKSTEEIWQMQLEKLQKFKEETGHANVPSNYPLDPKFAKWLETQRSSYRRGQMSPERIEALEGEQLARFASSRIQEPSARNLLFFFPRFGVSVEARNACCSITVRADP